METLVKDVLEHLKKTIAFLDKLKVDKKQKSDKENILKNLRVSVERCEEAISRSEGGQTYDDLGPANASKQTGDDFYDDVGSRYDDLGTASQLPPPPPPDEADGIYDDTGEDSGQTYDDVSGMTAQLQQIEPVECESLVNPTIADFLELKKEKTLLKSWQKKWCVIHSGILYIYDTAKDKKQKEAFRITDYTFKVRDDNKRKERCFELRNNEKVLEFSASDKESRVKWSWAFGGRNAGSLSDNHSLSTEDNYDDLGDMSAGSKKKKGFAFGKKKTPKTPVKLAQSDNRDEDGDIYEETAADSSSHDYTGKTYDDTGLPSNEIGITYDDTGIQQTYDDTGIQDDAEDLYEDTSTRPSPPPPSQREQLSLSIPRDNVTRRGSSSNALPPIPAGPKPSGFPNAAPALPARDETGSASGTLTRKRAAMPIPGTPDINKRELPLPPGQEPQRAPSPTLPPPPPEEDDQSVDDGEALDVFGESKDDFINMYQGMWDCYAHGDDELAFKRGEIIHILSKEYDDYGWWTAESRQQEIGLVPVSYLMKAFDV